MLRIFYGAAGTGKSAAAMKEIAGGAGTGERYILLVPEQYSHEAERELCAFCGDAVSLYAEVLSFTALSRSLAGELGGMAATHLDKGGRLLCMALAADGLYSRLRVYGAARHRAQLQSMLLGAVDELKSACVSPEQLMLASEECGGALGDKLHDLSLVLEAYDAVVANGRADPADRLTVLAQQIERSSLSEKTHIFVDGFTDFTAQERRVLEALILKGVQLTVCLGCDELDNGSEVFALSRLTARSLMHFAREHGCEVKTVKISGEGAKAPALRFFSDEMFSYRASHYEEPTDAVRVIQACSMNEECEWAASRALQLIRETGCRRRDIAIAVSGFEDYRLCLEAAFARYGVPLYTTRKTDMLSKPIPALIEAAYEITLGGWETEDVLDYIRTGFAGLSTEECDELENYVFLWQIHGSAWTRPEPWSLHPDGFNGKYDEASIARLDRINSLRNAVVQPLERFAKHTAEADTALGQAQALAQLFDELELARKLSERAQGLLDGGYSAKAQEYSQLWDIVVNALEQCAAILGDMSADAVFFGRLFTMMLSRYDIGTIPPSLDCVTAGELDRMRRRNIRHLLVLGATDERIPGVQQDAGVFSADERRRLLEMDIDLGGSGESELWRAFSVVYNCLTLPSDSLSLSYPMHDASGAAQRPAFVVNRASAVFSLQPEQADMDRLRTEAIKPALLLAANSLHGGGTYAASAAQFISSYAPERLKVLEKAANMSRGSLSRSSVRALYGDKLRLSASRIDKFASCRFAYFMQYALRAKPYAPAQFTAPEMGTFMHTILEKVSREVSSMGGYKNVDDETLIRLTDGFIAEYIRVNLNDFKEKSKRFEHLFRRLQSSVRQVVLDLAGELRSSSFEPLSFELDFSSTPELPPVRLGSGEDSLELTGVADRVDGWLHDGKLYLRIVDYKTGQKQFRLSDVLYGMNLQMLLYLFSLGENGSALYGREIVPAGVLYVPARSPSIPSDTDMDDEALQKEKAEKLRRSGLILDDPAVIAAMENSDMPKYLPVRVKRGADTGSFASAERMGALARHIDETLCRMASELRGGSIAADPYYAGQQSSACTNCDYFEACHFIDGENGESMRIMQKLPATKVWSILEGGEENG